ncbi:PR domain zinc finger protein 14-like [Branchiostoma floridae x Branchiostoma belcheri]
MTELGEDAQLGHVSTVVAKMWKKLPADRRKDWKEKAQRTREDIDMGLVENKRCDRCNTSFTRDKDLKYHLKGCMECTCTECGDKFSHTIKLKRHMAKLHRKKYTCNHCNMSFSEGRNLTRHQRQKSHN